MDRHFLTPNGSMIGQPCRAAHARGSLPNLYLKRIHLADVDRDDAISAIEGRLSALRGETRRSDDHAPKSALCFFKAQLHGILGLQCLLVVVALRPQHAALA